MIGAANHHTPYNALWFPRRRAVSRAQRRWGWIPVDRRWWRRRIAVLDVGRRSGHRQRRVRGALRFPDLHCRWEHRPRRDVPWHGRERCWRIRRTRRSL